MANSVLPVLIKKKVVACLSEQNFKSICSACPPVDAHTWDDFGLALFEKTCSGVLMTFSTSRVFKLGQIYEMLVL